MIGTRFVTSLLLAGMCLLAGCSKKRASTKKASIDTACDVLQVAQQDPSKDLGNEFWNKKGADNKKELDVREHEARLVDIPIPVQADSLGYHEQQLTDGSSDSLVLAYRVHLKQSDICSFFEIEMERLGWDMLADAHNVESLLMFVKPTKVCTISLRNTDSKNQNSLIVITCANNKAGYSQE
jgi:hypothetical protein